MVFLTIITPMIFLVGSIILYRRFKHVSLVSMAVGFLMVVIAALFPFLFPFDVSAFSGGDSLSQSAWRTMRVVGYIGSIGALISALSFFWFAIRTRGK